MKRAWAIVTVAIAIAGCAGEPLRPPEVRTAPQYAPGGAMTEFAPAAGIHGGDAQRLVPGRDIPAQWWTLFRSPALDGLVRQALDNSPTLARADAKLRQVDEDRQARTGATQLPRVDARLSANRVDVEPQAIGAQGLPVSTPLNLYLASVGISYKLDLFGATRNELEALRAEVD